MSKDFCEMHNTECKLIWTGKYTVCRCVWARLSPENWQVWAVKGLIYSTSSKHKSLVKHGFSSEQDQVNDKHTTKSKYSMNDVSQYIYSDFTFHNWHKYFLTIIRDWNLLQSQEHPIYSPYSMMSHLFCLLQNAPFILHASGCPV